MEEEMEEGMEEGMEEVMEEEGKEERREGGKEGWRKGERREGGVKARSFEYGISTDAEVTIKLGKDGDILPCSFS